MKCFGERDFHPEDEGEWESGDEGVHSDETCEDFPDDLTDVSQEREDLVVDPDLLREQWQAWERRNTSMNTGRDWLPPTSNTQSHASTTGRTQRGWGAAPPIPEGERVARCYSRPYNTA